MCYFQEAYMIQAVDYHALIPQNRKVKDEGCLVNLDWSLKEKEEQNTANL